MLILLALNNGGYTYHEMPTGKSCERLAPVVAERMTGKSDIKKAYTACVVRYKA